MAAISKTEYFENVCKELAACSFNPIIVFRGQNIASGKPIFARSVTFMCEGWTSGVGANSLGLPGWMTAVDACRNVLLWLS